MKSAKQTILAYMLLESTVFEKYRITFGAAHLLQIFIFALPSIAYHSVGTSKWLPKKILKTHIYAFEILILTLLLLYVLFLGSENRPINKIYYILLLLLGVQVKKQIELKVTKTSAICAKMSNSHEKKNLKWQFVFSWFDTYGFESMKRF